MASYATEIANTLFSAGPQRMELSTPDRSALAVHKEILDKQSELSLSGQLLELKITISSA